jgi:hypothetical protein
MTRISQIPIDAAEPRVAAVLAKQEETWGSPLNNHLLYARRPTIFRGARAMWGGLSESGLIEEALHSLLNRRVAALIGCEF